MTYPNHEYGIQIDSLNAEDIKKAIARQYRTSKDRVELSPEDASAKVSTVIKYSDLEEI